MSLCSPSIQQYERQMYFYWADYPRAHCPTVRDAYAWAPLSTVAERWVMFMTFSDFLSPSQFCTSCIVGQWSGEFNANWQPLFILLQESSKIHHQIKRCNTKILAFVKSAEKKKLWELESSRSSLNYRAGCSDCVVLTCWPGTNKARRNYRAAT